MKNIEEGREVDLHNDPQRDKLNQCANECKDLDLLNQSRACKNSLDNQDDCINNASCTNGYVQSVTANSSIKKIAGQAVLEGVMLQSATSLALAVRDENGDIRIDSRRLPPKKKITSIPFVRGVVNFVSSMVSGVKTLLKSADIVVEDVDVTDGKSNGLMYGISMLLGFALAIFLFVFMPIKITQWIGLTNNLVRLLIEGLIKIVIMLAYFVSVAQVKDIRRTFMYHGAEHKTIACYEAGDELTVDNVRKHSRYHDRCGTSFIVFVMLISIVVSMLFGMFAVLVGFDLFFDNNIVKTVIKIALLPLVASICYEMLMLFAKSNLFLWRPFKWLGKQMQRITTKEPTDDMIEVAIAAHKEVQLMDDEPTREETHFPEAITLKEYRSKLQPLLDYKTIESSDIDWILVAVLGVKRDKLRDDLMIPYGYVIRADRMIKQCAGGLPLQYVLGNTEFYGQVFKVNKHCLIPRMETELVCEQAINIAKGRKGYKVLDLCCGSGCIGITIAKQCAGAHVTCADVSKQALAVCKSNAKSLQAELNIVHSDMFSAFSAPFHMIVCNPPYIRSGDIAELDDKVAKHEPLIALDGGEDGLDYYRILAEQSPKYLYKDGQLVLEIGYDQAEQVKEILNNNFIIDNICKDYGGQDRIVIAKVRK
ncbi:MAG: peptide chain release factor N(5)-glutamine methyltransferase [Clostridia bacterium]|nr:peptide chain release factor N(5)-glutamine methyltransferase [Clostridia bacterium]